MKTNDLFKQALSSFKQAIAPLRVSKVRAESNRWLKEQAAEIEGNVLSIGSGNDSDGQSGFYRNYFAKCDTYTTSEISDDFPCDLVLDVRSMPELSNDSFDCIFCSGVLEHVDDFKAALKELTRILKTNGILLLGLPFGQSLHMEPQDFWRFTEYGIRHMLEDDYEIIDLTAMDQKRKGFPAAYWVKALKKV